MEGKQLEAVGVQIEGTGASKRLIEMPNLPKPLSMEEKKYLLAVERGDAAHVKRMIQKAFRHQHININCVDSFGRGALTLAIDTENLEMVELLIVMGVETRDSLLQAIHVEFVEAVEILLEHEELIHKEGEPYSWEKIDWNTSMFMPDVTPLILAAHRNNYEIIKLLLDRGATLPMPHDTRCSCDVCIKSWNEDSLRHSMTRVDEYRALASPSLIALSSTDPILTAFQLSWELRNLAFDEQECKAEYMELRRQCQKFAVDLLSQTRSSQELAIILNHDPDSVPYEDGEIMQLARLELAILYKQKKFVAHPNIQQLLATMWYEGLPGFRRKPLLEKCQEIVKVAWLFPFYCLLYMFLPESKTGQLMRKPFMKFLIHAASYLFFLLILILVSQRAEVLVIQFLGTESMKLELEESLAKQRGNGPTFLECIVIIYVLGFIWEETWEVCKTGLKKYLRNMWNFIDFSRNFLYVMTFVLRVVAYVSQQQEIQVDPATAYIPRERWDAFDPQLVAEGLFAAANILSALKLVHVFSINPHLGPLQISLGRMIIDIVKFFFIYSLVLFAFACGINQLMWYFAELERKKCYSLPGEMPDWANHGDSCTKWRTFGNLFESSQSLFWASFGGISIDNFDLSGIKSYTRFWGLLMFGSYSVINVIVLLNLLIAMMSNSYAMIEEHSDSEWKFARTKLWMSYFEDSPTLPPPFNIFPTPKLIFKMLGLRKKDKKLRMSSRRKERKEKERDHRYTMVMRALVWRYVSMMHRQAEDHPVCEDDINEVKAEVSAMKCEILDVLERNGMDVSSADRKERAIVGRKTKVWERRLMKDFHVAPVTTEDDLESVVTDKPLQNEDPLSRFRRVAKMAISRSANAAHKWGQLLEGVTNSSQIGRCSNQESWRKQQNLQRAMNEAKLLVSRSPTKSPKPAPSPVPQDDSTLMVLLKDLEKEIGPRTPINGKKKETRGTENCSRGLFLAVDNLQNTSGSNKNCEKEKQQKANPGRDADAQRPSRPISPKPNVHFSITEPLTPSPNVRHRPETPETLSQSPLKSTKSPPKVFKKKAPSSPTISQTLNSDKSVTNAKNQPERSPRKQNNLRRSPSPSAGSNMGVNYTSPSGNFLNTSTEYLLPSPSPEPLRVGQRIDDVSTIKRPSKGSWM